ncbi:hypothetical protein [Cyanobium sp. ATX 6A2]|uniref:hypothetical protein n=1 Tax=Cyanobium sp. ATX 6A2 TaxID=2823700 RepID=UPI0020CE552D|nr:hypothetical protein [Cyanobium sp. ATX 6A2]
MFDAFTKLIAQADGLAAMVADSIKRMDSFNRITPGDGSALMSDIGTNFDRAAAVVG